MRKNGKSEHVSACMSKLLLCPTRLHFAKLICGRWLAQNLRESLQNSPGTAYCTGGKKQSTKLRRVCDDTSPAEVALRPSVWVSELMWILLQLLDWYNQIHPLPISFRGASHVHASMQVLPVLRDYRCNVTNSGDRMTKVNKDRKPWVHHTYTQSLVFLTPSSYWNWSSAHLMFHSDCCWQKAQEPAAGTCLIILFLGKAGSFGDGGHVMEESMCSTDTQISLLGVCSEAVSPALKSSVNVSFCHRNMSNLALFFKYTFCSILYPLLFCVSGLHH